MKPVDVVADPALLAALLARLLDEHAPLRPCALVPAIRAWHAADEVPLWQALETAFGRRIDAPFFCVPWPGAQALARAIEDGLVDVRVGDKPLAPPADKRPSHGSVVADVGCGSGVAAIAAVRAGAGRVLAVDVDPLAVVAASMLAAKNGVDAGAVVPVAGDALANPMLVDDADVILAGDLVYSASQADAFRARVNGWREAGKRVVLADSGRPFFTACGLSEIARYDVAVPKGVDGAARRTVRVYA